MRNVILTEPRVSPTVPGRYGRDFYEAGVGFGRIEEAPPETMVPDANAVSRVIARFCDLGEEPVVVEVEDRYGNPYDLGAFRIQVLHEDLMVEVIDRCIARVAGEPVTGT